MSMATSEVRNPTTKLGAIPWGNQEVISGSNLWKSRNFSDGVRGMRRAE